MSEDWKPGDLAVCLSSEWTGLLHRSTPSASPVEGKTYSVSGVSVQYATTFLGLQGFPARTGWDADKFRKVRPDQQEPCEEEFITLLNRTKRSVQA